MPQHLFIQVKPTTDQFDGAIGNGGFRFSMTALDDDKIIVVDRAAYSADNNGTPGTEASWYFAPRDITNFETQRVLLARAETELIASDGTGSLTCCPGIVPREPDGDFYDLVLVVSGKTADGQALISYHTELIP